MSPAAKKPATSKTKPEPEATTGTEPEPVDEAPEPALIPARIRDKVCIVGFADGHRADAPNTTDTYDDTFEYWGINRLHVVLPDRHWTRWFEIHPLSLYQNDENHQQFMRAATFPIYIRPQDMLLAQQWGITSAVAYPVERILNAFPPYFNNTISWLTALAISMQFTELRMYGVDMAQDTIQQAEYSEQRPSCEFFLGIAAGVGINVVIPPGSDLLKSTHLYGFSDSPIRAKLSSRLTELNERKTKAQQELAQWQANANRAQMFINQMDGAMQEIGYELKNLLTLDATPT